MGFRLGNEIFTHGLVLAPMAGYTDRAMRMVCSELGAELAVTEMVSAKAVTYGDKKTALISRIGQGEGRVALQIFGSDPEVMARASESLQRGFDGEGFVPPVAIDVNMGCPVNKIFGNGEGSALMRDPELIYRIVRAVSENIDIPCTVKLRSGIDERHINAIECAQAAQSGGAVAVAIHGRTRAQMYGGIADRDIIKNVKSALQIPVIANGDIVDAKSAIDMYSYTGCDGIMIGRGAVGNPFVFAEIKAALDGGRHLNASLDMRVRAAKRQLSLAVEDKGERIAIPEARKQIAQYFKGFRGSAALRAEINSAACADDVIRAIDRLASSEVEQDERYY